MTTSLVRGISSVAVPCMHLRKWNCQGFIVNCRMWEFSISMHFEFNGNTHSWRRFLVMPILKGNHTRGGEDVNCHLFEEMVSWVAISFERWRCYLLSPLAFMKVLPSHHSKSSLFLSCHLTSGHMLSLLKCVSCCCIMSCFLCYFCLVL